MFKVASAFALLVVLTIAPATASAVPAPANEEIPISRYAQSYHPPTPRVQLAGADVAAQDIELPPRGTFSVAIVPRVSYPVANVSTSSGWGPRTCSGGPCTRFHEGLDYPGAAGAPIKSIAAGTVRFVGMDGNYGNKVVVDHVIDGVAHTSVYAHMQHGSFAVRAGQKISRGQSIGRIGNTGRSYGNHLHLEVHVNGVPVNPAPWLSSHKALPFE